MSAAVYETSNEKAISGALALVMHLLFFALLVLGVTWQKRQSDAMVAELWSSLPQPAPKAEPAPRAEPAPPPRAAPEPPAPAPKAEPKPAPKAEPKPQPKADIELREKREKERKAREQAAAEKKKREEQARLEAARAQQAREAREAAEAKRRADEQARALREMAAKQAAARSAEIEKYKGLIRARIVRFIVEPPNLQGNPEAELDIIVLPGGEVLDVRTRRPSGQAAWDNAVERAIRRAQPLPLPTDPALLKDFRELNLKFRPKE